MSIVLEYCGFFILFYFILWESTVELNASIFWGTFLPQNNKN